MNGELKPTFLGLTKSRAALALVVLGLLATSIIVFAIVLKVHSNQRAVSENQDAISLNKKAVAYICSTTAVLDKLVVTAADQLDLNFKNGTFKKLLEKKFLTPANIAAAKATRDQYRAAHVKLTHDLPCELLKRG